MISKTSRQLIIFHVFVYSEVVEFREIIDLIKIANETDISKKTIMRDIKELQKAGLINIRYSKRYRGYVHVDNKEPYPFSPPIYSDNKLKNLYLDKLIRLGKIMIGLKDHNELPYYDEKSHNQETCSSWYRKKFPNVSTRTMQRDFKELRKIGYDIEYQHDDKYYIVSFPEGIESLENTLEWACKNSRI